MPRGASRRHVDVCGVDELADSPDATRAPPRVHFSARPRPNLILVVNAIPRVCQSMNWGAMMIRVPCVYGKTQEEEDRNGEESENMILLCVITLHAIPFNNGKCKHRLTEAV